MIQLHELPVLFAAIIVQMAKWYAHVVYVHCNILAGNYLLK